MLYGNRKCEEIIGYRSEELIGKSILELNILSEKSLNKAAQMLRTNSEGKSTGPDELELINKEGRLIPVEISTSVVQRMGQRIVLGSLRDITDRRRVEGEIQALTRFPSENPNPVLRISRDGALLYANEATLSQLPDWNLQAGRSAPSMLRDAAFQALTSGKTRLLDLEHRGRVYSFFVAPITDAGYANMYGRDITDSKRAEEELRKSEELYRSLFENMLNGFAYCKMLYEQGNPQDFVYLHVNNAFESLTGLKNVIGKKVSEVIPGIREVDAELFEIYGRVALTGKPEKLEKYVEALKMWFSISLYSPKKEHFVAVFDVITQRKQAEEKLRESERFAFSTMDALTAHIAVLDENGTIIAVNKAWRDFAASNPPIHQDVCEGAKYLAVCGGVEGEDQQQTLAFAQGVRAVMAREKKEFSLEYPCHSPSRRRWFVGRVTRFSGPGPLRIVVAHENITERKLAEEDLRLYREQLEELVRKRTLELQERNAELVQEIAERRRAEKAIHESEERFRIIVDLAPDIIYRIKEDRTIDFISTAVRQLGYQPEELIGRPFEEIIHPDDRPQVHDILVERRIGGRTVKNIEVRLLNKVQGEQGYALSHSFVELSARGYWDVADSEITRPDKHFLHTLGIAHDVTARKQAEDALKESEKRIGLLKDVASAANAAATIDDVLKVAVEGIARYIGWPVGHVYAIDDKNPEVLIPTDIWYLEDQERFHLFMEVTAQTVFTPGVGMIGRVLESKRALWVEDVTSYPDFLRKKLADDLHVHGAFGFPVIAAGKVTAVLEFFSTKEEKANPSLMDVMDEIGLHLGIVIERKQAEAELHKLSRAVEQSPATVVITDMKGRIQYVNPKFTELTGYTFAEAIGKNPRILSSGIHPQSFYKDLWSTILSGHEWYGKICNRKKTGEIYWEHASISPVRNEYGRINNFVAVKEDVTKLLQYEDELKQAKEIAENANRAKSDFLASMSHELRTPLNAIIGFSEVLKEQFFGPLIEKQEEYVEDILESGRHLLSLINDILDLAKVEAGKMELDLSLVNVADLINNSLIMIREKAMKHNIFLNNEVQQEVEGLEIMADARKLKQVLFNLLSNAAKFTSDGGTIRLVAKIAHGPQLMAHDKKEVASGLAAMSNECNADFLEISVEDTGMGIIAELQKKVFEPFYQVKGSKQDKTPGTGLGLPLSKDLVELHGGKIWVESGGEGKGSKFSFKIPIERGGKLGKAIDSY